MRVLDQVIYNYLSKEYNHMFDELMKEEKMTQTEIDVLAFLYNNPEYKHARDIVEVRRITKAQASIAIDKLVRRGMLSRVVDDNCRRCHILKIEEQALPIIDKIVALQHEFKKRTYQDMSEEEIQTYLTLLEKIYQNAKKGEIK